MVASHADQNLTMLPSVFMIWHGVTRDRSGREGLILTSSKQADWTALKVPYLLNMPLYRSAATLVSQQRRKRISIPVTNVSGKQGAVSLSSGSEQAAVMRSKFPREVNAAVAGFLVEIGSRWIFEGT